MTDDTASLVLEHLLAIRAQQDRHGEQLIARLDNLERDFASMRVDLAAQQLRLDALDQRLARIETALVGAVDSVKDGLLALEEQARTRRE